MNDYENGALVWSIGGIIMTGENRSTPSKT